MEYYKSTMQHLNIIHSQIAVPSLAALHNFDFMFMETLTTHRYYTIVQKALFA